MYAQEDLQARSLPRTKYAVDLPPVFYTNPNAKNPFAENGPQPNDVTAAMFLILRTQDLNPDVFVCPTGIAEAFEIESHKTIQDYSNFRSQSEIGYAMANPYPSSEAVKKGFKWDDSIDDNFAIAADIGPGDLSTLNLPVGSLPAKQRMMNSPNHDTDGQNVLYGDGHCDWVTTAFQGDKTDNIYTYGGIDSQGNPISLGFVGAPQSEIDSVILPPWDSKISKQFSRFHLSHFLEDNLGLIMLGGILVVVVSLYYLFAWLGRASAKEAMPG